jgi:hypothetical protein
MSIQASIDISFVREQSPSSVLSRLVGHGWGVSFNGEVMLLPENGFDDYEWIVLDLKGFDFPDFMEKADKAGRAGIVLVFNNKIGGGVLISMNSVSFSLSINRVLLADNVPDFSWYVSRMLPAFHGLEISGIQCETIF